MASITTWTRLEPRARGDDLTPSLEARVYDPAWLLGRQWQVGEFVGEDDGSPVHARLTVAATPLTAYGVAASAGSVDSGPPLDCLVGAEPRGDMTLAERAEAGMELLSLLGEAGCSDSGIAAFIGTMKLPTAGDTPTTTEGAAFLTVMAARAPDGGILEPLLETIASSGRVATPGNISASDQTAIVAAATAFVSWRATLVSSAPASSWVNEKLEYQFSLAAQPVSGAAIPLAAPSWDGDRLDWYDVDVDHRVTAPARPSTAPRPAPLPDVDATTGTVTAEGIPSPLTYPGMPAARWWQFEDARVNFAQVTAAPEDLARMLIVEFASVYGNDWYLWPLELPVGAIHRVALEVVNTFGETIAVQPVASSAGGSTTIDWQVFRPTEQQSTGASTAFDGLLLLPTLASPLASEILEDVQYVRDEGANMAWAIEGTVEGDDGLPVDRHNAAAAAGELPAAPAPIADSETQPLRYRFETDVPTYWFPLVPDAAGTPKFTRLVIRRVGSDGAVIDVLPKGELLSPPGLWLWQEEVPREGARATRRFRMARGADGRLYVWSARRSQTGRGEASSGLRYDDALPTPTPSPP